MSTFTKARSALALASRDHPAADHSHLRNVVLTESAVERIARIVDQAPPLTAEQRDRLVGLLHRTSP